MNEVKVINQTNEVSTQTAEDFKNIALQWLTSTGNLKKFTENEKNQFFDICCAFKLNPIKKEVYGVKYGDNFNIIVGYETYLKRAQRTGLLDGFNTTVEKFGDDVKAICTIYRKDWTHPFIHEVYLSEYNTKKSLWLSKPITMIKKVAEAQAFRKCFTDELGGMPYTKEELPDVEPSESPVVTVETVPPVKTQTTSNKSSNNPKNLNTKKAPLYTPEQAKELGAIVNAKILDEDAFSEEEKTYFRQALMSGKFEEALKEASETLKKRVSALPVEPVATTEADDLDAVADGIF